jgi:hypothetical protein
VCGVPRDGCSVPHSGDGSAGEDIAYGVKVINAQSGLESNIDQVRKGT